MINLYLLFFLKSDYKYMRLLLCLLFSCVNVLVSAQGEFRSGYIVTNSYDTIKGLIEYRVSAQNNFKCIFKRESNQNIIEYKPNEIRGYTFENDKVLVSKSTGNEKGLIFMEQLVRGKISLFVADTHFYVEKSDSILLELVVEKVKTTIDNREVVYYSNKFRGTLSYVSNDCPEMQAQLEQVDLKERSLTSFVEKYNSLCNSGDFISFKSQKKWSKLNYRVMLGINRATSMFVSAGNTYSANSSIPLETYNPAVGFLAGLGFEYSSPRVNERLSGFVDVLYHQIEHTYTNQFLSVSEEATLDTKQIKIPVALKYTFSTNRVNPYVAVGLATTYNLSFNTRLVRVNSDLQTTDIYENTTDFSRFQLEIDMAIGMNIKTGSKTKQHGFFFEVRRGRSRSFVKNETSYGALNLYGLLGYTF